MATGLQKVDLTVKRLREMLRNPAAFAFKVALRSRSALLQKAVVANPKTFNQKVRHRMVHDRRPLLGVFADKLTAKEYVESRIGPGCTAEVLDVADAVAGLNLTNLPKEYVLKVSHASGGVIMVFDGADPEAHLPEPGLPFSRHALQPAAMNLDKVAAVIDAWLQRDYGANDGEWAYSLCQPRVFVEEFLRTEGGGPPPDLKLFVFDGKCRMMRLDKPFGKRKTINHYQADGVPMMAQFGEYHGDLFPQVVPAPELPSLWSQAVELAEELGKGLDFVRVDTFQLGDRVLIGELTNYPTNGTGRYIPRTVDRWLGGWWKLEP